ncbi:YwdI family protein [Bacillus marasmi]|uniref:YwdI family protein n=1 Tax=Bacillus marasmi TaxID=1926279 RepID=UPI0011C8DE38|nr:YwdI family protein [Bacillus marasmi]
MNIPLSRLLQKMEEEIQKAQSTSSEANIRERVRAIKTLCELVLEEPGIASSTAPNNIVGSQLRPVQPQPMRQSQGRQLDSEDDANGDSLFDF